MLLLWCLRVSRIQNASIYEAPRAIWDPHPLPVHAGVGSCCCAPSDGSPFVSVRIGCGELASWAGIPGDRASLLSVPACAQDIDEGLPAMLGREARPLRRSVEMECRGGE